MWMKQTVFWIKHTREGLHPEFKVFSKITAMQNKSISLSTSVSNPKMGIMLLTRLTCYLLSTAHSQITTSTPILQCINYADSQQQIAWAKFHVVLTSQQEALQNYYTDVLWSSFPYQSAGIPTAPSTPGINLKYCLSFPFFIFSLLTP